MKYITSKTPLIVIAGNDDGMGSSRDWAAKGSQLQGIKAGIAESFERIHRSNLVGRGFFSTVQRGRKCGKIRIGWFRNI